MQRIKDAMVALDVIKKEIVLPERFRDLYRSFDDSKKNLEHYQNLYMENPGDGENKRGLDNATQAFSDVSKAINMLEVLATSHQQEAKTLPEYDEKMKTLEGVRVRVLKTIEKFNKDIAALTVEMGKKTTDANVQSIIQNEIIRLKDMNKTMQAIGSSINDIEDVAANDLKSQDNKMEKNYKLFMKREENTEKGKTNLALMTKKITKELTQVFSQTPLPSYIAQDELMRATEKGNLDKDFLQNIHIMNRLLYGNGDDKSLQKGKAFIEKMCGVDMKNGEKTKKAELTEESALYKALQAYATPTLFEQNFANMKASEQKSGLLTKFATVLRSPAESETHHASQNTSMLKMLSAGVAGHATSAVNRAEEKAARVTFKEGPTSPTVAPASTVPTHSVDTKKEAPQHATAPAPTVPTRSVDETKAPEFTRSASVIAPRTH